MFDAFMKVATDTKNYIGAVSALTAQHRSAMETAEKSFAGDRLKEERQKEMTAYSSALPKMQKDFEERINKSCDSLREFVISKITKPNQEALKEVQLITAADVPLDELECTLILDKYISHGDYHAAKAMMNYCDKNGIQTSGLSLLPCLEAVDELRQDALSVVHTYVGQNMDELPSSAEQARLIRIVSTAESNFPESAEKFNSNPICNNETYENYMVQKWESGCKSGNIDDKISIGQQIVDLGFSENVKENSVLSKAVALA